MEKKKIRYVLELIIKTSVTNVYIFAIIWHPNRPKCTHV